MDLGKNYFTNRDKEFPQKIRELQMKEDIAIRSSYKILHKFDYFQRRLLEIQLNKKDFYRTIEHYKKAFEDDETVQKNSIDYKRIAFIDINRAFINFVSSFKSFVEHIEKQLQLIYGSSSHEYLEFKKYLNKLYDEYFSYKLLIRLRDFSIHKDYSIQSVHFDRVHNGKGGYTYEVNVHFNKSVFMQNKVLRKKLSADLIEYEELFDPKPFVNEVMDLIQDLFKKYIEIDEKSYLPSAEIIRKLAEEAKTDNIGITVTEMDGLHLKHETKIIPVEMAKDFFKLISE